MVLARKRNGWLVFALLILLSNTAIYHMQLLSEEMIVESAVVLGSLLDIVIIMPLAMVLAFTTFSLKKLVLFIAMGCMAVQFIIPAELLAPYQVVVWLGLAIEGIVVVIEVAIIVSLVRAWPRFREIIRQSTLPPLYAIEQAVEKIGQSNVPVRLIATELVMFYYAIATWKKPVAEGVTLYKNTSFVAMQLMIIHAIILESIGLHWWLHSVAPILSIVLLLLNIYGIFFLLGDMQAMRLTPILFKEQAVYITYGLLKKVAIPYDLIDRVVTEKETLEQPLPKSTLSFIVRDFEAVPPQMIIKMKEPIEVSYYMGIKKYYSDIALQVDQPVRFLQQLALKRTMDK